MEWPDRSNDRSGGFGGGVRRHPWHRSDFDRTALEVLAARPTAGGWILGLGPRRSCCPPPATTGSAPTSGAAGHRAVAVRVAGPWTSLILTNYLWGMSSRLCPMAGAMSSGSQSSGSHLITATAIDTLPFTHCPWNTMKNITFTADERLIEAAREQAAADNSTLNEQFRRWLEQYARKRQAAKALEGIDRMRVYVRTGGRKFTRDQMNER
jgi:hypothetical protein